MGSDLRHKCDSNGCYVDKLFTDWTYFNHSMPNKLGVTDLDGVIERNGMFFIIEYKSNRKQVEQGQLIMLKRLSSLKCFTVYVVWGSAGLGNTKPEKCFKVTDDGWLNELKYDSDGVINTDEKHFSDIINTWLEEVELRFN